MTEDGESRQRVPIGYSYATGGGVSLKMGVWKNK